MKQKWISFLLVSLLLYSSCSYKQVSYPSVLTQADSLAVANPDSAVSLLKLIEDEMANETEATRMYYRLLCIKANDKAYIRHRSDSAILSVLHYYVDKNDRRHLPEAYYYAGRVYRDLGDAPQALDYFGKGLNVSSPQNNLFLRSLIHSQMGSLFVFQNMYEEALVMFREGHKEKVALKDTTGLVYSFSNIARCFNYWGQNDSAIFYYKNSHLLASQIKNRRLVATTSSYLASIYINIAQYDSAKYALHQALPDCHRSDKPSVYATAARLYYQLGQMDSVAYFYNLLVDMDNVRAKYTAHQGLAAIALNNNQPLAAYQHLVKYQQYSDSIRRITNTETIRQMHSLYNYQLREKENQRLEEENKQKNLIILWSVFGCILLALLGLLALYYIRYIRSKKMQLHLQVEKLHQLQQEKERLSMAHIEANNRRIEELEKQLQGKVENELRERLEEEKALMVYANKKAQIERSRRQKAPEVILASDIFQKITQTSVESPTKRALGDKDWMEIETLLNEVYLDFTTKLRKLYPFNPYEYHVCLLLKLSLRPSQIARLTEHSEESVSSTRRRLYEKVFGEKGTPSQWDDVIYSI